MLSIWASKRESHEWGMQEQGGRGGGGGGGRGKESLQQSVTNFHLYFAQIKGNTTG